MKKLSIIYISKRNIDEEIQDLTEREGITPDSLRGVATPRDLLVALSGDVKLYKNIVIIGQIDGSFQKLVDTVAMATGLELVNVQSDKAPTDKFELLKIPKGGKPIEVGNKICGCVVESKGQKLLFMPDSVYKLTGMIQTLAKYDWLDKSSAEIADFASYTDNDGGRTATALKNHKAEQSDSLDDEDEHPRFVKPIGKGRSEAIDLDQIFGERKVQKGPMRLWLKLLITILVFAVIGGGLYFVYRKWGEAWVSDFIFSQASAIRDNAGEGYDSQGESVSIKALSKHNSDVCAWVSINNTAINYPVVLSESNGEDYYQDNCFFKFGNRYGTPHVEADSGNDLNSKNVVIYGSNIDGKRVFASLNDYRRLDYYRNNYTVKLDTVSASGTYEIFAVSVADESKGDFDYTKSNFSDNMEFSNFISEAVKRSYIITPIRPFYGDELLTLVVDSSEYRSASLVVMAKKIKDGESADIDISLTTVNENQILPDESLKINTSDTEINTMVVTEATTAEYPTNDANSSVGEPTSTATEPVSGKKDDKTAATTPKDNSSKKIGVVNGNAGSEDTISVNCNGKVYTDTRVNAIARIIQAEIGSGAQIEAMKAQGIAAYTYIRYMQAGDPKKAVGNVAISPDPPSARCLEAAKAIDGICVMVNGWYIPLYFSDMTAGRSAWGGDVWGGSYYAFTSSVDSSIDTTAPYFSTTVTMPSSELASYVKSGTGIDLTKIKDKNKWLRVTLMDANGLYVNMIMIGEQKEIRGEQFKLNVMHNRLRSHAFTIEYNPTNDEFTFHVKGHGHGVGMSQYGANQYAKQGADFTWILEHYFNLYASGAVYVRE